jgi:hypothetical protein
MRKTIFALVLSAVSVVFGIALAGAGGSPAAADTAGVATSAESVVTQVQQESPDPDDGERSRNGDHNCPDRDGDGEPDTREDGQTSLDQA